jgi:uncharacterized membrane protein YccC
VTALDILAGLVLAVLVLLAIRPRAWDPQLKKPHDWTKGEDDDV